MKKRHVLVAWALCLLVTLAFVPNMAISQSDFIPSTSPLDSVRVTVQAPAVYVVESDVLTFSEYPLGTAISNQYAVQGIFFGGDNPFISLDGSNPTAPVLSGTPRFQGAIEGIFVDPSDGETPTIVESFSFDAGYFDALGSTRIEWFDPGGNKLGQRTNTKYGIEGFDIEGGNIARWRISIIENEPAGYAIDNVSFNPVQASILFREKSGDEKDGSWGFLGDEIPGFDHSALNVDNVVYESHPGYSPGTYYSQDGQETAVIVADDGVQSQHTKETFKHDAKLPGAENSPVINFEEIPIDQGLAESMRNYIETQAGASFQYIDYSTLEGIDNTLSPSAQKGGNGTFTCVGIIEWAAEQAGHNNSQGFIRNVFESIPDIDFGVFPPETREFPLLSPQLLNYAMKFSLTLENITQWFQGIFDPVDFMITDPLGRRLGFTVELGEINEIPKAFYSGNGNVEQFLIPNPVAGVYQIEFTGLNMHVYGAISSSVHSEGLNLDLAQGEKLYDTFNVELMTGAPCDVTLDGNINEDDVAALLVLLNSFTNAPNDPADIDGDGIIGQSDIDLCNQLINISNQPPAADAGSDQTVEQAFYQGADVTLDGSGSYDPDADPLIYTWTWAGGSATGINPTITLPLGITIVTLTVDDGIVTDSDMAVITIVDTTPPTVDAGLDVTIEQATGAGTEVTLSGLASDICDADLDYEWSEDSIVIGNAFTLTKVFNLGTHTLTLQATDDSGNVGTDTVVVNVIDTTLPELSVTPGITTLWPPNHKHVTVNIDYTVSDICDAEPEVTLISVTSDEIENETGDGDGNTLNDIVIIDNTTIQLRAERQGSGDGRVYTINYSATDTSGNTATASAIVTVLHDQADEEAIDSGVQYIVTP